jgi:hypothetical protein
MSGPVALPGLWLRAERYQRWHEDPAIAARTSFFAAAAVVNRVMARHVLLSRFLLDLGSRLEAVNTGRALEIRAGRLYGEGSVEGNTLEFVQYEQSIVQAHLARLRQCAPRSYRREIRTVNAMLAALRWGVIRGSAERCFVSAAEEALQRLGGPLDFAEQHCRVILGMQIARRATFLAAGEAI